MSSSELTLDELFAKAKLLNKAKSSLSIRRLIESEQIVRRNWRLVRLDMMNLSLEHVKKVDNACDKSVASCDKIGMIRLLLKLGIESVNIDRLYFALKSLKR